MYEIKDEHCSLRSFVILKGQSHTNIDFTLKTISFGRKIEKCKTSFQTKPTTYEFKRKFLTVPSNHKMRSLIKLSKITNLIGFSPIEWLLKPSFQILNCVCECGGGGGGPGKQNGGPEVKYREQNVGNEAREILSSGWAGRKLTKR